MSENFNYRNLRVLVIDDDEFMLDIVSRAIERLGIEFVETHQDGRKALARIDAGEQFDIVLVDLNMPEFDGVEVLRNLAAREFHGGILLFSGEDARILKTAQSLGRSHNLQILGAMPKPVTTDVLRGYLARYQLSKQPNQKSSIEPVSVDALANAIRQGEIVPFYQPKVRVQDRSVHSLEVLARWKHPERGMIPPLAFIPLAEEHGLIQDLTWSIFDQVFGQIRDTFRRGQQFSISLNLSVECLYDFEFPERVAKLATEYSIDTRRIDFEITESRLIQNITVALDVLTRLRLKGFGLSIDDFGTGYSSMAQLAQFPFTELKIDHAFVHGSANDLATHAILEHSVALGKKLGIDVVAEGVEDQSDWDTVESLGCDLIQGYFVARPMPLCEFDRWQQKWISNVA
jgi:EAL domain-containing protein (putative c-di-GMP-specific phosphodiesterase class I)/ActR/RegA family two-component response regulator